MQDVPLSKAQIIWDADDNALPIAKVIAIPSDDDRRYRCSWGACNADFKALNDVERVNALFRQFAHMVANYGVDGYKLHEVFMAIPEYRHAMIEFGALDPAES